MYASNPSVFIMMVTDNKYVVDKLFEDFAEWRLKDNPEYGTNIGIHKYDDQISHWTEEAFLATLVRQSHPL